MTSPIKRLARALEGRYRLDRELGAGGMATVYLAHDLKHERDVAIKVLHPDLGAALGGERFLSEIRTTARLQHPHILPLLDSGDADGLLYYVMPLVTGETLRARLERERQLPIADAVRIAREVASALDYAHRQNVIHRDIKPENILLHDGSALVADFGIALAVQSAGGQRMTQTGLSLGTPQYMSPEQAMGERTIDARSDIYALGAVTYEMLAGDAPFLGSNVQAIVAKVLSEKPTPLHTLRDTVPEHIETAVLTALAKLPADRFASAKEFIDALGRDGQPTIARTSAASARTSRGLVAAVATLTVVAGAAGFGWWRATRGASASAPAPALQFTLDAPEGTRIVTGWSGVDISSTAHRVAFVAQDSAGVSRAYVRSLNDVRALRLEGTEGVQQLFFSPDGAWMAFVANGKLKKVPATGGNVEVLADVSIPRGGHWAANGFLYLGDAGRILVVPENGGASKTLRPLVAVGRLAQSPRLLGDGETLLFTDWSGTAATSSLMAYSIMRDSVSPLGVDGSRVLDVVDGLLVYGDERGSVSGAPYDAARRAVVGDPRPLSQAMVSDQGLLAAALASDGSVVYRSGEVRNALTLVRPGGAAELLQNGIDGGVEPRLSPDATRIAFNTSAAKSGLLIYDLTARAVIRLGGAQSSTTLRFGRSEWTPASDRVVFRAWSGTDRSILAWQSAGGSGVLDTLHADERSSVWEGVVSPNGEWLLFRLGTGTGADLRYRRLSGDTTSQPLVTTPASESDARFSPDGQWVAYASDEAGRGPDVYVRAFPDGAVAYRITQTGGTQPVWARDGRSIYYVPSEGQVVKAQVDAASAFRVVARDTVVRAGYEVPIYRGHATYDVMPDGRLVLMRPEATSQQLVVTYGWLGALRAEWTKATK